MKKQSDKSKKIWVQRNFVSKKLCIKKVMGPKTFGSKMILGQKNCVKVKFWMQNTFGPKIFDLR